MKANRLNIINDRHELMNVYSSQCTFCKHFKEDEYSCVAFPAGIPDGLLSGEAKHNRLLKGQTGETVFTAKDELKNLI